VDGYSHREVAQKAGVGVSYVNRLVELGILKASGEDAFSQGDVRRARWVHSLEAAGVPLDGMAAAVGDGTISFSFLDASAFDRFAEISATSFLELSDRTGIPLELLKVVREAVGFAEPRPEDHVREDELAVVPAVELLLSIGVPAVMIGRWLRVCADSLRRITGTEADLYRTAVMGHFLARGMSEPEMLEAQAEFGSRLTPLMEQALLAAYRGQQEHAWKGALEEFVEAALERTGRLNRLHRPPAVCFLDITGYTRLTEERGDEAAAGVAERLAAFVRRSSQEHRGEPVKWLGDGVMFYFPDPGQGVLAALEMSAGVAMEGLPPAHVGMHAGPVVFQEGDYFGRTVNIAARIAEYARPGEVLVSQEVVDAAPEAQVTFAEIGPVELKGVSGTLTLHAVSQAG
jgi:adenylate cyclase